MQPQKLQPERALLPGVPGIVAVLLVAASFLLGHVSVPQHAAQVPAAGTEAPKTDALEGRKHLQRRDLRELQAHEIVQHGIQPPLDPLDTIELERFMLEGSGLTKHRPALTPGASGDDFLRVMPFQILSWAPRMLLYPAFLDRERCERIMHLANRTLFKSSLAYRPGEKYDPNQDTRTSSGTFMSSQADDEYGTLAWLEERIAAATLVPTSHGEAYNVLRYENGQHYHSHMDPFDPKEYGKQVSNRIATFIVYLTDTEEGGETLFKREGWKGDKREVDYKTCDDGVGYKVKARRGDAVLFWDSYASGEIDYHALHAGCPVVKGEKWVAVKWLRNSPSQFDTAKVLDDAKKSRQQTA